MKEGGLLLCFCYHWSQRVGQGGQGETGEQQGEKYLGQVGGIQIDTGQRFDGRRGDVWFWSRD